MIEIESMFGGHAVSQAQITTIPITKLVPYDNQPFKLYAEDKLKELATDIQQNGLLSPIIVRPLSDGTYQILAGHNRVNACKLNDMTTVSAIVKNVSDEEADLILVQSNLQQRQTLSKKELALAYRVRNDALKKMAKKGSGSRSLETLAESEAESARTIARYIRASQLIPDLLERFDSDEFSLPIAENLAALTSKEQRLLDEYLEKNSVKVNKAQSEQLKNESSGKNLTPDKLAEIMSDTPKRQEKVTLDKLHEYAASVNISIMKDDLSSLLDLLSELKVLKYKIR